MKTLYGVLAACFVLGLLACLSSPTTAADKDKASNKEKLLGTWELVKVEPKSDEAPPAGTTVEFAKDGKLTIMAKVGEKTISLKATYTLEGNKLKTSMKGPDGKEHTDTDTITKLTDEELVLKGAKEQVSTFKKKK
jgi:uncharacterized protein (TIGR03066 family)